MDGGVKRLAAQSQNGGRIENVRQYGAEINKMSSTRARAIWGSAVASRDNIRPREAPGRYLNVWGGVINGFLANEAMAKAWSCKKCDAAEEFNRISASASQR